MLDRNKEADRLREMQKSLYGYEDILPGFNWLERHLQKFPAGQLPEQKLVISVDDGKMHFTVPTKVKNGEIKKVMEGL